MRATPLTVQPRRAPARRQLWLLLLTWAFTSLNTVRVLSYLPAMWAIWQQRDSSQHSLLTWGIWFGANLTMALWLREHNGQRMNGAAWVSAGNAAMCGITLVLILAFR